MDSAISCLRRSPPSSPSPSSSRLSRRHVRRLSFAQASLSSPIFSRRHVQIRNTRRQQPSQSTTATVVVASSSAPSSTIAAMAIQLPPVEQALILFGFIMCTMLVTILGLLAVSIPTLFATKRVIMSLERLMVMIRSEVPGTLSSLRMSGREINDLMVQLNQLRDGLKDVHPNGQNKRKNADAARSKDNPIMN